MTRNLLRRIAVQAGILLLMLAVLEGGLRFAGFFHRLSRTVTGGKAPVTVLCVGDSYTYGGDTPREKTYPAQLQKVLDERAPGSFRVVNGGNCEDTSREMLDKLDGLLDKHSPDIGVMFIGSANLFKLYFQGPRPSGFLKVLTDMRIYKMAQIIRVNLRALFADSSPGLAESYRQTPRRYNHSEAEIRAKYKKDPSSLTPVEKIWYFMDENDYSSAEAAALDELGKKPEDLELLYTLGNVKFRQGDKPGATKIIKKLLGLSDAALAKDPADLSAQGLKAFCLIGLADMSISTYRFSDAIPHLLDALDIDPGNPRTYYLLAQSYSLQSSYTAASIEKRLEALTRKDARLPEDQNFLAHLSYYRETSKTENRVKSMLQEDIAEAIGKFKKRGARLIIPNYPVSFPLANNALKEAAEKNGLEFLDMEKIFKDVVKRGERDRYLLDMDHYTPEGNRFFAEFVADVILKKNK